MATVFIVDIAQKKQALLAMRIGGAEFGTEAGL